MRKKNIDFQSQMKNSEQFLQKLQSIKQASKDIKDKNKLTTHRNIWVKQFKYLSRLERDSQVQLTEYLEDFDRFFQYQYEEKQIFGKDKFKNFKQLKHQLDELNQSDSVNIWSQLNSLPILLEKIKKAKIQDFNMNDIRNILTDIGSYLRELQVIQENNLQQYGKSNIWFEKLDEQDEFLEGNFSITKPIFGEVKGFDFEITKLKQIQQGQQNLIQYLQSMTDKLSQDQISQVISQFHHASNLLQQAMELQIQKISLDYEQALSLDSETIVMSENFQKINHFYSIYLGRGKSVAHYYERLGIQFPKINRKILERITQYIEAKIFKQKKIKSAKRNFLREKQQIYHKVQKEVNLRIENKIKKAQKQAERLSRQQDKLKLEKQLESLRKQYNARQNQKIKQNQQKERLQKQQQRKKEALRKLYLDDLSKKVKEVHEIKEEKEKKEKEQIKINQLKEIQTKKRQIQANKPKVNYRHSVQRKKLEKKIEQKEFKQTQKVKKQQRINQAIESYDFRPVVQPSQQRLTGLTEGLIKRRQTKYDKADKIQLSKVDGYTVNQLMGDMRYRLNTMLHEVGLSNTQYAKQVIMGMSKRNNN